MTPIWWKRALAELIATFVVTFFAAGAICTDQYSGGQLGLFGCALAYALATAVMLNITAPISGGHTNPAVTLAVWLTRGIELPMAALYLVSQLSGATIAALVLMRTFSAEIWQPVALGTPVLAAGVSFTTGLFIEAVLTSFVVFTVLQVFLDQGKRDQFAGFTVGAALLCGILLGGPLTGAAMNPARAFGPALVSGVWPDQLVYWLGPLVGAILGTFAYSALRTLDSRTPAQ
jgi:MIP family channel proteins